MICMPWPLDACLEFVCWSARFDNRQDLLEVSANEDSQATKRFFTLANVTKGSVESLQPSLVCHGNLILSSFFLWKSHFFSGSNAFSQKIMNSSKFLNIYFVTLHTVLNSTCGQRDMKWAPLRHISDLERQKMIQNDVRDINSFHLIPKSSAYDAERLRTSMSSRFLA